VRKKEERGKKKKKKKKRKRTRNPLPLILFSLVSGSEKRYLMKKDFLPNELR
jgi:hypothetical protein